MFPESRSSMDDLKIIDDPSGTAKQNEAAIKAALASAIAGAVDSFIVRPQDMTPINDTAKELARRFLRRKKK